MYGLSALYVGRVGVGMGEGSLAKSDPLVCYAA